MELKGMKACRGYVTGKAYVIGSGQTERLAQFPEGHILVTDKTTPEFTHIFQRATAIVTQVGGILSHAAIVSREYGVPCIVGVKDALTSIRDGQEVTVDANLGVVTFEYIEQKPTYVIVKEMEEPEDDGEGEDEDEYCTWCESGGHSLSDCNNSHYCDYCEEQVDNDHSHDDD